MKDKEVVGRNLHGFKKGLVNLISFCDKVTGSVDKGRAVIPLNLDLRKAFDSLPQSTTMVDWSTGCARSVC